MALVIRETTMQSANAFIKKYHRHSDAVPEKLMHIALELIEYLPVVNGQVAKYAKRIGVAVLGYPSGRFHNQDIIELRRVCFIPDEKFSRLKRYYPSEEAPKPKKSLSSKNIAMIEQLDDTPLSLLPGIMCKAWTVPSNFLLFVEHIVKRKFPNFNRIVTYIREHENGIYLKNAGYYIDKHFERSGSKKYRLTKPVSGFSLVQ